MCQCVLEIEMTIIFIFPPWPTATKIPANIDYRLFKCLGGNVIISTRETGYRLTSFKFRSVKAPSAGCCDSLLF